MKRILRLVMVGLLCCTLPANSGAIVLDIFFDDFPGETAFGVWEASAVPGLDEFATGEVDPFGGIAYDVALSSPIGFGDGYVVPGDFDGEAPGPWQFVWNVNPGTYVFGITDTFGDGICCAFGGGSFTLTVDGQEVISGGAFSTFALDNFESTTPIPLPGALLLFGSVLAGWVGFGRRNRDR